MIPLVTGDTYSHPPSHLYCNVTKLKKTQMTTWWYLQPPSLPSWLHHVILLANVIKSYRVIDTSNVFGQHAIQPSIWRKHRIQFCLINCITMIPVVSLVWIKGWLTGDTFGISFNISSVKAVGLLLLHLCLPKRVISKW